ncbi:MAG: methyltransferase, partial [Flavobacteriaceae bacterium]|nr:methyltransferase [Flavobacteriaceae bacterium]
MKKNTSNIKTILRVKDYLVSGESFDLIKPYDVDYLQTRPIPKPENLEKYYKSDDYISHNDSASGFIHRVYRYVKKWNLNLKFHKVKRHLNPSDQLLDIGAGTG